MSRNAWWNAKGRAADTSGGPVLVTGASSGLGRECALDLERRGFEVLAGVRRVEDGEKLLARSSRGRLEYAIIDVTDEESVEASAEFVRSRHPGLRGLVNNAGIAVSAPLETVDSATLRRQLETNVVGQLAMVRAHLPHLRRSRGRIVNITSGLGRVAIPYLGAYAAAQFAKEALSDALRRELATSGVGVSVVQPGAIMTPIWGKISALADDALSSAPPAVAAVYRASFTAFLKANAGAAAESTTTPQQFADAVARALTDSVPRTRYRVGPDARTADLLSRILPDRLLDRRFAAVPPTREEWEKAGPVPRPDDRTPWPY
ncbi:SDR family oxidoreductase [Nocardiopsis lambiniae]|uniref:SDR family oxidoreductase n=1 Tax=Nocardiopsis lambiniae TaxID=3075539 RepID=A0ABU2MBX6_9ACTN|nr:SDR family oxidoreductase [Nocardiopsis sp. DSM 44743]MDT0330173.1 SDR family oxidoreductase [Nocardiopsis sp. DSM 44743]